MYRVHWVLKYVQARVGASNKTSCTRLIKASGGTPQAQYMDNKVEPFWERALTLSHQQKTPLQFVCKVCNGTVSINHRPGEKLKQRNASYQRTGKGTGCNSVRSLGETFIRKKYGKLPKTCTYPSDQSHTRVLHVFCDTKDSCNSLNKVISVGRTGTCKKP